MWVSKLVYRLQVRDFSGCGPSFVTLWVHKLGSACKSRQSKRVGCRNSVVCPIWSICSGIEFMHPTGRKVSRGVDSLTIPMMGWLRKLFARLRGSRPVAQVTPVPTPESESTEAQPPTLSYRITVETGGGGEETHHYSRPGLPVTKDESIDLGEGRYVTVLEVVEEAQPGAKDGTIRAKLTPPPPPST